MAQGGICPDRSLLEAPWREAVSGTLAEATLAWPEVNSVVTGSRIGAHTEHRESLLAQLQEVTRAMPGLQW